MGHLYCLEPMSEDAGPAPTAPPAWSDYEEEAPPPPAHHEHAAHHTPETEVLRAAEIGRAAHSLAHAGYIDPADIDPVVTSAPATGQDLHDIQAAVIEERAAARPPIGTPVPECEPISPDMAQMVDDMTRAGGIRPEVGSRGVPFREDDVPAPGETPNYPPRDGAAGAIETTQPEQSAALSRVGSERGDFFAAGSPSLPESALAPTYDETGACVDPSEYREYSVTGDFPAELSTARPAFAQPGGATQLRTALSAEEMRQAGLITLDYEQRPATPEEAAEIDAAVCEAEGPPAPPSLREPISPDMAQMVDDMERAREAEAAARAARPPAPAACELPPAPVPPATAGDASTMADISAVGGELGGVTRLSQGLGTLGAVGGIVQTVDGVSELHDGDIDNGVVDTGAGLLGTGTGVAATGLLGPEAAATVAAPPVAVGVAAVGLASAGHHYQAEHDTWGPPQVDRHGHVHHQTSVDFTVENAHEAYDQAHDAVAHLCADRQGHVGMAGEVAARSAGLGFGGLMGLGAGLVGFGGDLVGGLEATADAGYHLWRHLTE
ncbi:MAG TPA: glycohydrolase toxin TNT-related protein [Kofleriaceae bacterium]|nr:glycohydrolase toxin TNT-related protein [Kofleriaceae bacterium]